MSGLKQWYSAAEMAELKLPGLPGTERGVRNHVKSWQSRQVQGKGGRSGMRTEYQLPPALVTAIKERAVQALVKATPIEQPQPGTAVATDTSVKPAALKDWQRQTAEARAAICSEVRRLAEVGGTERAVRTMIELAGKGGLAPHLQSLVTVANAKAGASRALSRGTLYRWLNDSQSGWFKLAPKSRESIDIPSWAPYLLKFYQQPQKPSLAYCMEQLAAALPAAITVPSYDAANRFLKKMCKVEVQRGRMGNREIKNIRPFVRRDTTNLHPGDVYTADGHTFDAEIAHPRHGRPFRPEITVIADVATRRVVGWSIDLAESGIAVLYALTDAVTRNGIPLIFYVDNGSGYNNAMISGPSTGMLGLLNIEHRNSIAYNSQARGLIERLHKTLWVNAAKKLPTYMGADMDKEARNKIFKLTRADIKTSGSSRWLMDIESFKRFIESEVEAYNSREHRGLPRVRDTETGRFRHHSPNSLWQQFEAQGITTDRPNDEELIHLVRPQKKVKVANGEVRLFNNRYFSHELKSFHGDSVRIAYDLSDANQVWVYHEDGRFICLAGWDANKRDYFPLSVIEQKARERATGRIKRAQAKIEEAEAELNPPQLLECQPAIELPAMRIEYPREQERQSDKPDVEAVETAVADIVDLPIRRPMFDTDAAKYRWLMTNGDQITSEDKGWLSWYRKTSEFEDLFEEEVTAR